MPSLTSDWHEGESAMQEALRVPPMRNPTNPGLPARYDTRIMASPLVALGTVDARGRPWTTIWGGERGFARRAAEGVLALNSVVDRRWDPVLETLWEGQGEEGAVVRRERAMSALAIDLETRDRLKLAGGMISGEVVKGEGAGGETRVQLAMAVTESLGNCPKYLNKKAIQPHGVECAELKGEGLPLGGEALGLLDRADLFFLSSAHGESMDTNHRGGPPGFVRVLKNGDDEVVLVYPEYSGNRHYQTLGNLKCNPLVGIVVPDFTTGDVLYLTGSASILIGEQASSVIARTKLAVSISATEIRYVKAGLPFRGSVIDYSPYNPPVRRLLSEQEPHVPSQAAASALVATLVDREPLTPTVSRFTFQLSAAARWIPGQHVTLDFADELDSGYAHMKDDDPQSLNDDYVRTFTVSNAPGGGGSRRMEVTARRHGPATGLLWRHDPRVPLDIPVMGFGGEEAFRMSSGGGVQNAFVAGGVGITPLLAQASAGGLLDGLRLLWSLRFEDVPLAAESFGRIPGLAGVTRLFITGGGGGAADGLGKVREMGAQVEMRRMSAEDVAGLKGQGVKFYLCAAPVLLSRLNEWLDGEDVVWEDFEY